MLIENLGHVTFVNGILRVQCTSVDPEGKIRESGVIEIPGGSVNAVLNGLVSASKAIQEKLETLESDGTSKKTEKKKEDKKNSKKK